jgi:hypothetical protein
MAAEKQDVLQIIGYLCVFVLVLNVVMSFIHTGLCRNIVLLNVN